MLIQWQASGRLQNRWVVGCFAILRPEGDDLALYVTKKGTNEFVLDASGNKIKSIFGREIDLLKANGYTFLPNGIAVK